MSAAVVSMTAERADTTGALASAGVAGSTAGAEQHASSTQ
jgi:hypothetical protein